MSSVPSESAGTDPVSAPVSGSPAAAPIASSTAAPSTSSATTPSASSTAASSNSPAASSSSSAFRPIDHRMGKYRESYPGKGDWFAISGGVPKCDWSGIVTARQFNPKQSRPVDTYQQSKLLDKRCEGVLPKFKTGDNLTEFKSSLFEAFIERGLDTITYLPDLSTFASDPINSKMFSTIEHYSRFCVNPEKSKEVSRHYQNNFFDDFDSQNSDAAKRLMFNSIDSTILTKLKQSLKMNDCFNVAWITFLGLQLSTSSKHYDDLRRKLREIDVQRYPLQNIADLCLGIYPVIKELENANQYQPSLTLAILQRVRATCTQDLQFPVKLDLMTIKVEQAVKEVSFLSNEEANAAMANHEPKLDPDSVLQFLKEAHNDLLKDGLWKPANRPKDIGTVPSALVSPTSHDNSISQQKITTSEGRLTNALKVLLQLDQASLAGKKDGKKTPENSPCKICGKLGHWAPNCPDKNKPSFSSTNTSRSAQHSSSSSKNTNRSWKRTPPGPNDPQTKKVNRTNFFWCAKCNRWSTSHGTNQHIKKESSDINQSASLAIDPGVWLATDHELMSETGVTFQSFLMSILGLFVFIGMSWLFNFGHSSRVVGSSIGVTHAFLSLADHFSSDQICSKAMALNNSAKHMFNYDLVHIGKGVLDLLFSLCDITSTILCHAKQLPLCVFIAPCLWLSVLLLLVTKGPSKTSKLVNNSKKVKMKRSVRRNFELFIRRKTRKVYDRLHRWWLHGSIPPKVKGRRYLQRKYSSGKRSPYVNRNHITVFSRNQKTRARLDHAAMQYVAQLQNGASRHHLKYAYGSRHKRCSTTCDPYQVKSAYDSRHDARPCFTSSQLRALTSPIFNALKALVSFEDKSCGFPIIWDTGASICVTHDKNDFVSFSDTIGEIVKSKSLGGLAKHSKVKVEGEGFVVWLVKDVNNRYRTMKLPCAYIPKSQVRLLSTSVLGTQLQGEEFVIRGDQATLSGVPSDILRGEVRIDKDVHSNLLVSRGCLNSSIDSHINFFADIPSLIDTTNNSVFPAMMTPSVSDINLNLSDAQKELLRWHQRLGHISFAKVQHLLQSGALAKSESARRLHRAASQCVIPKCSACLYAKQRRRPAPTGRTIKVSDRDGILRQGNLLPGQEISVDHFMCSQRGRLFQTRGKESDKDKYCGGCIFVDHASNYVHIEFMQAFTSHATLDAKTAFEAHCRDHGVIPAKFLTDNGSSFTSKAFVQHLNVFQQVTRFAGVGSHHQNGHAERSIQTIMSISRAMMIHSAIHWPQVADSSLWPAAVAQAVFLWNHMPDPHTGLSPSDIFTRSRYPLEKFHDLHVWGCPAYVLDKTIADGKKLPRWKPRSSRGMYLGRADKYASSVPLILNLQTGSITPQFHVVTDDWFATVSSTPEALPDFNSPEWITMFGDSTLQYVLADDDVAAIRELSDELEAAIDTAGAIQARDRVLDALNRLPPPLPPPDGVSTVEPWREMLPTTTTTTPVATSNISSPAPTMYSQKRPVITTPHSTEAELMSLQLDDIPVPLVPQVPSAPSAPPDLLVPPAPSRPSAEMPTSHVEIDSPPVIEEPVSQIPPASPPVLRRSQRNPRPPNRLDVRHTSERSYYVPPSHFHDIFTAFNCSYNTNFIGPLSCLTTADDLYGAYATNKADNPDIFTFNQILHLPDKAEWIKAAETEIAELEAHGVWEEVPMSEVGNYQIVPSTWVFRLKRAPDGTVLKRKARICLRGDLMKGFPDTYSPVVAFSTIRMFLVISLMLDFKTCSIDFSNAFVQAKMKDTVYMKVPQGFKASSNDKCLKLLRSLYGSLIAPKMWSTLLFSAFKDLGFTQSTLDKCLWYKKDIFVIIYVDDCGISAKTDALIDELIEQLQKKGFKLTKEGTFSEFLGIQYSSDNQGNVHLSQEGLIKKILAATGLEGANPNKLPARREPLSIDPDDEPFDEPWNYSSVVGMLLYLSTNTRPDITFAVSQVARFTHSPKKSHGIAVKMIVRYLKGTIQQGTIVSKFHPLDVQGYSDADFCGLFKYDPDDSVTSAKSRAGYIIKVAGCPLVWKSQLMQSICLSTAESEYYSLSLLMRAMIPIRALLFEMITMLDIPCNLKEVKFTIHVDNTSAITLAVDQKITSRTRHYHAKMHHFWTEVNAGSYDVMHCKTSEMLADYLTKGLPYDTFVYLRHKVQGW